MNFSEKFISVLFRPRRFWLAVAGERRIMPAIVYFIILLIIFLALYLAFGLLALRTASPEILHLFTARTGQIGLAPRDAIVAAGVLLAGVLFVLSFLVAAILYCTHWIVGGTGTYGDSYKAFVYGSTPVMLLLVFPYVSLVAPLWMLVLQIMGFSSLQRVPLWRGTVGVVLGYAICAGLLRMLGYL